MQKYMSNILAIDTSTEACSCALNIDGEISELFELIPRQHASELLPMVKSLLISKEISFSDIDAVAYGRGPGSFTGLRIAAGVTQGIAYGLGIPVLPVSTLASLAHQVVTDLKSGIVFCTLDARIDEIYWGLYQLDDKEITLLGKEGLCKPELLPDDLLEKYNSIAGLGSGMAFLSRMPESYQSRITLVLDDLLPRAASIATLAGTLYEQGQVQSPEQVQPIYLRDKVTHS